MRHVSTTRIVSTPRHTHRNRAALLFLGVILGAPGPRPTNAQQGNSVQPARGPEKPRALRFGTRVGLGLPWLSFNEKELTIRFDDELLVGEVPVNNTVRPSFVGGLTLTYEVSSLFALEPRLFYCGQGGELEGDGLVTIIPAPEVPLRLTVQETYKLSYLEIPVLARFSTRQDTQRVYFGIGPVAGILLQSKYAFETSAQVSGFYPDVYAENLDVYYNTETVVFGLLSVFGVEFRGKRASGFLELSFEFGLTDVYETLDVHSRVLGVMLGVGY